MNAADPNPPVAPVDEAAAARATLARWLREAARTAFLRRPRWQGLSATPAGVAWLALASLALAVALDRLYIGGPATFYAQAFGKQWFVLTAMAATCWVLQGDEAAAQPRAPTLFALLWLQALVMQVLTALVLVPAVHAGAWGSEDREGPGWGSWAAWLIAGWYAAASLALAARGASAPPVRRGWGLVLLLGAFVYGYHADLPRYWYPKLDDRASHTPPWRPSPEDLEAQPRLFAEHVAALGAERPGRVDLYALTFAPYADEDVFKRESALVAEVIGSRLDAMGRTMQLLNHRETLATHALATPRNLQRAIEAAAQRMNRDEDILFLHLTSHGASSGALSARFAFLDIGEVRPEQVKAWLDAAGVKWRVVSVSACYSGTWIAPLADEHTLVLTAADARHTSYGCGRKSELTYFGRAVYDEALRRTRSFEEAHAAARVVIERREREAGKADGYSNPQLHVGSAVREQLNRLRAELEPEPPTQGAAAARP